MIYYSEFYNRQKSTEEYIMQRLVGNFELFDRYRLAIGDERFFATVRALAEEYMWDHEDTEEVTKAREKVVCKYGNLFDASLIEDLFSYYEDYLCGDEE